MTWVLPRDLRSFGLRVSLSSEPLLLYWHTTDAEVDVLLEIIRAGADDVGSTLVIDESALALLKDRSLPLARTVVAVLVQNPAVGLNEVMVGAKALSARAALIRFPEPQQTGYGWLERDVKSSLYKAMGAWFASVEHPLAPLGVRAFPMMEAAGLTADPVELLALVEAALQHRLRYVDLGMSDVDYRRSLLLATGERLAARAKTIPKEVLPAAVEVLLWGGKGPLEQARFEERAKALERAGLGKFLGGELRIGPLGRALSEVEVLGAFEVRLPERAWSSQAKSASSARRHRGKDDFSVIFAEPFMGPFETVPLPTADLWEWVDGVFPADLRAVLIPLVDSLSALPIHVREIHPEFQKQLSELLRWVQSFSETTENKTTVAAKMMLSLVETLSRRGANQELERREHLRLFQNTLKKASGWFKECSWADPLALHLSLWCADMDVARSGDEKAVTFMRQTIEEGMSAWTDPIHLSAIYQRQSAISLWAGEHDTAYEQSAKALDYAKQCEDKKIWLVASLSLAEAAVNVGRSREALTLVAGVAPMLDGPDSRHWLSRAKRTEARALSLEGQKRVAYEAGVEALRLAEEVGDHRGSRSARTVIVSIVMFGDMAGAEALLRKVIAQAEQDHDQRSSIEARSLLIVILLMRGESDEAARLHALTPRLTLIRRPALTGQPPRPPAGEGDRG